ncbi:hypothetical protein OYT1_ch1650 [Ferriphaselus amnicola]|uniref:Uncharacterized protein n=1 Tax=Ferriphaselus amnicola TaxID=1188319 RepID=A0A2Z6GDB1_9PROT|nr:hypothetical protein [Ferriphaselus amnicola]BBE51195.1 hypothetical protein OYT1_ch1650 [Ferriphaselus amnicola]
MQQLPHDDLDLAILIFKHLRNSRIEDGHLYGTLDTSLSIDDVANALEKVRLDVTHNTHSRDIEMRLPSNFFCSMEDILKAPLRRLSYPERFYLKDIDYQYSGDRNSAPQIVRQYIAAIQLFSSLEKSADHIGGIAGDKSLVFLQKTKVEISSKYFDKDLRDISHLSEFESEYINSDTHQEQKRTIIKTALFELFQGTGKIAFSDVLARFDEIFDKVQSSYQLYVAEFSFQKVKAEVEKEKLDAMIKLNKVFSDVQSQLLAVPVALVLVGGQMEDKASWTGKNILIWLGALIFAILMDLLIRNQLHTLNAVKQEIDQQRQQITSKYSAVANRFSGIYKDINDRHNHQKGLITTVDALVAIALTVTTWMLLYYSGALPSGPFFH